MQSLRPRRLLVGVAPTDVSDHALHAAARVARLFAADLDLVHAVPVPPVLWVGVTREELTSMHLTAVARAAEQMRERLGEVERQFDLQPGELAGHLRCVAGEPHRVLLEELEGGGADVLFLGRHQRRGVVDFGRTARTLLHRVHRPLWVQAGPWTEMVERVLVPVDFSAFSRMALDTAVGLAQRFGATIELLHVFEPPPRAYPESVAQTLGWPAKPVEPIRARAEEMLRTWAESTDWLGVKHTGTLVDGEAPDEILRRGREAQLVVMGSRGHTGLLGPMLGHVTYDVLRESDVAVLAVRG